MGSNVGRIPADFSGLDTNIPAKIFRASIRYWGPYGVQRGRIFPGEAPIFGPKFSGRASDIGGHMGSNSGHIPAIFPGEVPIFRGIFPGPHPIFRGNFPAEHPIFRATGWEYWAGEAPTMGGKKMVAS
jgi:hypothetical protein